MEMGFFGRDENVRELVQNSVKTLKITELYTLKGWVLRYVNYISIKLLLKREKRRFLSFDTEGKAIHSVGAHRQEYLEQKILSLNELVIFIFSQACSLYILDYYFLAI